MIFFSYIFFIFAASSVLIAPWPVSVLLIVLALIGLAMTKVHAAGLKMSVSDWRRALFAELAANPTRYAFLLLTVWMFPTGLALAGFIGGWYALGAAAISYLAAGRVSTQIADRHKNSQLRLLYDVAAWLGIDPVAFKESGSNISEDGTGRITVSPLTSDMLFGAEGIADRMLALMVDYELVSVERNRITFTPLTIETADARERFASSGGMLGETRVLMETSPNAFWDRPAVPAAVIPAPMADALDFSAGFGPGPTSSGV